MHVLVATESTADQRKTLAAVRSLGQRRGVVVTVGSDKFPCGPDLSRYCSGVLTFPSPVTSPDEFADALVSEASSRRYDVILPLSDYTTIMAVKLGRRLSEWTSTAVPPPQAFAISLDKLSTGEAAQKCGVATPQTWCVGDESELANVVREVRYPCVFKLRRGAGAVGLRFPNSPEALRDAYRICRRTQAADGLYDPDRPLVQERLQGRVEDACLLFDRGQMVAGYTQERLAMHPCDGGVGIHNRATDRTDVLEQGHALLTSLGWHGPAMVEFLRDERDGRLRLLEINPRFWGTLDLAVKAGVDFPWLTCRIALGDHQSLPLPRASYCVGLEHRWIVTHALRVWREQGWSALWSFLRPGPGRLSDICWSDPMPMLGALFGFCN